MDKARRNRRCWGRGRQWRLCSPLQPRLQLQLLRCLPLRLLLRRCPPLHRCPRLLLSLLPPCRLLRPCPPLPRPLRPLHPLPPLLPPLPPRRKCPLRVSATMDHRPVQTAAKDRGRSAEINREDTAAAMQISPTPLRIVSIPNSSRAMRDRAARADLKMNRFPLHRAVHARAVNPHWRLIMVHTERRCRWNVRDWSIHCMIRFVPMGIFPLEESSKMERRGQSDIGRAGHSANALLTDGTEPL